MLFGNSFRNDFIVCVLVYRCSLSANFHFITQCRER